MSVLHLLLVGLAADAGGAVNALAGGGPMTVPMLTAVGIPVVTLYDAWSIFPSFLPLSMVATSERA